jgi:hypothetical protein
VRLRGAFMIPIGHKLLGHQKKSIDFLFSRTSCLYDTRLLLGLVAVREMWPRREFFFSFFFFHFFSLYYTGELRYNVVCRLGAILF